MTIHYSPAGGGTALNVPDGVHIVKAAPQHTGGAYEVFELDLRSGQPVPLHSSPWSATVYLLEGSLTLLTEAERLDLAPGDSATVPAGTLWTSLVNTARARALGVTSGTEAGKFFAALAQVFATHPDAEPSPDALAALADIARHYGVQLGDTHGSRDPMTRR